MEEDRDDDGDLEESDVSVARIDDSIKTQPQEKSRAFEEETPEPEVTGIRDTASEEYLWQMMIDKHGRQHFELIY